ncbi:MAG TPA: sigma-E factor regulatory protein RseB domain-containing protein [Jiangellaceae bacterium]|nr:sigma-E factor regulatory protein RseB domain-containing protein [Jiangellaceae bacterium]
MPTRSAAVRHIPPTIVVVLVAGVLVVGALVAPAYGHRARSVHDDPRAVALLYRAMDAPDRISYSGTQYVSAWSVLDRTRSTSAIVHVRHTAGMTTLVTDHGTQPVTLAQQGGSWLAGNGGPVGLLVKAYDVELLGHGRVAGRPADMVGARRPDGSLAARLWLDAEYAFALRREVYDEAGRTVSASAFIEINLASAQSRYMSESPRTLASTAGLAVAASRLSQSDLIALRSTGWRCPSELGDGLVLYEATRHDGAIQLSYSDGVTTVSVFEQPGQLDPAVLDGFDQSEHGNGVVYTSPGPPSQFVWATGDGRVITVVADGSLETVDSVLQEYPPIEASAPTSLIHRIGRGAKKFVSWLNPFD